VTVYLVGAGPGDPGLLTRRGAALLARADVVLHDRLVSPAILDLVPTSAELIDVGKGPPEGAGSGSGSQEERQQEIARLLVEHGRRAAVVVRLKGGDPFLFGRGGEEVEVLTGAGIAWQIVPGVTSAIGVPGVAGIPVTHRGLASSVTVVTGRVGDAAAEADVGEPDWAALARAGGTLVILMGMHTRAAIAQALMEGGRAPDTPVAVIARGTTPSEQVARTTLAGLADVDLGPPAVIVVGPVAALGATRPSGGGGPLAGRTVVVTRGGRRGEGLVAALERAGARTLELALTRQIDPGDGGAALRTAAAEVRAHDWMIVTSVNAVDRFMAEVHDARELAGVFVAAVGPATADALRLTGIEPELVPAEHSARGLIEQFPAASTPGSGSTRRVLFPCADLAPDTIPDGLAQKGWEVHRVEAYRTIAGTPPDPAVFASVEAADAVVFTATSSVHAFLELRTSAGAAVRPPGHVVCIGPTTASAALDAGFDGVHEAWGASAAGIVAELVGHFSSDSGDRPAS
jgi:uroporphyrinogen III methyltransferase/synthase